MPELPEVETVRSSLSELVSGKKIKKVAVGWPNIIKNPEDAQQFADALIGQTITGMGRRGKFLIFYLEDYSLVSHLRMEGKYSLHEAGEPGGKHTHVMFYFTDGTQLHYDDVRKFGTMHLFSKGSETGVAPLAKLGPEPFDDSCTPDYLLGKFCRTERNVKAVLLDQTIVTGLGNIYVDEVLYQTGIHPERPAKSLTMEEAGDLCTTMEKTLRKAIELGGSTIRTYVNSFGENGTFQSRLFVYGREGEPCRQCGTEIVKTKCAGRGTHFCPSCQTN